MENRGLALQRGEGAGGSPCRGVGAQGLCSPAASLMGRGWTRMEFTGREVGGCCRQSSLCPQALPCLLAVPLSLRVLNERPACPLPLVVFLTCPFASWMSGETRVRVGGPTLASWLCLFLASWLCASLRASPWAATHPPCDSWGASGSPACSDVSEVMATVASPAPASQEAPPGCWVSA